MFFQRSESVRSEDVKSSAMSTKNLRDIDLKSRKRRSRINTITKFIKTSTGSVTDISSIMKDTADEKIPSKDRFDSEYSSISTTLSTFLEEDLDKFNAQIDKSVKSVGKLMREFKANNNNPSGNYKLRELGIGVEGDYIFSGMRSESFDNIENTEVSIESTDRSTVVLSSAMVSSIVALINVNRAGSENVMKARGELSLLHMDYYQDLLSSTGETAEILGNLAKTSVSKIIEASSENTSMEELLLGNISIGNISNLIGHRIKNSSNLSLLIEGTKGFQETIFNNLINSSNTPRFFKTIFNMPTEIGLKVFDYVESEEINNSKLIEWLKVRQKEKPKSWITKSVTKVMTKDGDPSSIADKLKETLIGRTYTGSSFSNDEEKDTAVNYDAETSSSVSTVIPGYMSRMLSNLTNSEMIMNNYNTGQWVSASKAREEHDNTIQNTISNSPRINSALKDVLDGSELGDNSKLRDIIYSIVKDPDFDKSSLLNLEGDLAVDGRRLYDHLIESEKNEAVFNRSIIQARAEISRLNKSRNILSGSVMNAFNDETMKESLLKYKTSVDEFTSEKMDSIGLIVQDLDRLLRAINILPITSPLKASRPKPTSDISSSNTLKPDDIDSVTDSQVEEASATSSIVGDIVDSFTDKGDEAPEVNVSGDGIFDKFEKAKNIFDEFSSSDSFDRISGIEDIVKNFNFKDVAGKLFSGENMGKVSGFAQNLTGNLTNLMGKLSTSKFAGTTAGVIKTVATSKFFLPVLLGALAFGGIKKFFSNKDKEEDQYAKEDDGNDRGFIANTALTIVGLGMALGTGASKVASSAYEKLKGGYDKFKGLFNMGGPDREAINNEADEMFRLWREDIDNGIVDEEDGFDAKYYYDKMMQQHDPNSEFNPFNEEIELTIPELDADDISKANISESSAASASAANTGGGGGVGKTPPQATISDKVLDMLKPVLEEMDNLFNPVIQSLAKYTTKLNKVKDDVTKAVNLEGEATLSSVNSITNTIADVAMNADDGETITTSVDNNNRVASIIDGTIVSLTKNNPLMKLYKKNPDKVTRNMFYFSPIGASITMKRFGYDPQNPSADIRTKITKFFDAIDEKVEEAMHLALSSGGGMGSFGSSGAGRNFGSGTIDGVNGLEYGGYSITAETVAGVVRAGYEYDILPSLLVTMIMHESMWGNSPVGKADNNWAGMSYGGGTVTRPSGVTVTTGTPRPEGNYYMRYQSPSDFFIDWTHLLRRGGEMGYNVAGHDDFPTAVRGLFIVGGSEVDYAEDDEYIPKTIRVRKNINDANDGHLDYIDSVDPSKSTSGSSGGLQSEALTSGNRNSLPNSQIVGRDESPSTARTPADSNNGRTSGNRGRANDATPSTTNRNGGSPGLITDDLLVDRRGITHTGGLASWVAQIGILISNIWDESTSVWEIGGYRNEAGSDHGTGHALDVMVAPYGQSDPTGTGSSITKWCMDNYEALNLKYVIFEQRIWGPGGNAGLNWHNMPDRGDPTQNHFDHPHISFYSGPGDLSALRMPDGTLAGLGNGNFNDGGFSLGVPSISVEELLALLEERPAYMVRWDDEKADEIYNRVRKKYYTLFGYEDDEEESTIDPSEEDSLLEGDAELSEDELWPGVPDGENSIMDLIYTDQYGKVQDTEGEPYAETVIVNILNNYNYNIHNQITNLDKNVSSVNYASLQRLFNIHKSSLVDTDKMLTATEKISRSTENAVLKLDQMELVLEDQNNLMIEGNDKKVIKNKLLEDLKVYFINAVNITTNRPVVNPGGGGTGMNPGQGNTDDTIAGSHAQALDFELRDNDLIRMILAGG